MANRNGAKGTMAETAVTEFLRSRCASGYPRADHHLPSAWARIRARGTRDEGDVRGPHTAIEVKNYRRFDECENALLDEAETKGREAASRLWFLAAKPAGKGLRSVHLWHAETTLGHLLDPNGWSVTPDEMSRDEFYAALPTLCKQHATVAATVTNPIDPLTPPMPIDLVCISALRLRQRARIDALMRHKEATVATESRIPVVVSLRSVPEGLRPPAESYAYTTLGWMADLLAAVGELPMPIDDVAETIPV